MLQKRRIPARVLAIAAAALAIAACAVSAQEKVLNLYSSRHYQTDDALYANFTKATGIRINRIDLGDDQLLDRLKSEAGNSPADVILMVDAARIWAAQQMGYFSPVKSAVLDARIPAELRDRDGHWFGFSTRARVIVYNKVTVKSADIPTYESLANPVNRNKVCTRSGSHPYMLSLVAAVAEHDGEAKAEEWARGVVANFARAPKGGDTDQLRAVAAGECFVAIANSYYVARMMRSTKPEDLKDMAALTVVWPNQNSWGTHVNVSGAGVIKTAPNKANAVKFLEYLASDSAQIYFADGNNEWPVVKSAAVKNPALEKLGSFKADELPVEQWAPNTAAAQRIFDRAGWR